MAARADVPSVDYCGDGRSRVLLNTFARVAPRFKSPVKRQGVVRGLDKGRGRSKKGRGFSSAMTAALINYSTILPWTNLLQTKVLTASVHRGALTLKMVTTQRVGLRLTVRGVCKQNVPGTNAWLWYMCNRVLRMLDALAEILC